jgi:hypothetical protein
MDSQLSIIPTLLANCTIPVHRPRMLGGVHSDTYEGTNADTMPTPIPPRNRLKYSTRRPTAWLLPNPAIDWIKLPTRYMTPDATRAGFLPNLLEK